MAKKPKNDDDGGLVNGRVFWQAVEYPYKACPKDKASLAHLVFHPGAGGAGFVVGSDGSRWHKGYLSTGDAIRLARPIAVTRESARELLLTLEYAFKMSLGRGGNFLVEQKDTEVVVHYGALLIHYSLMEAQVRHIPDTWIEPVAASEPEADGRVTKRLPARGHAEAIKHFPSWGEDKGQTTTRVSRDGIVRIDVYSAQEADRPMGTAFLLPQDAPAAALPEDEPLLTGKADPGQSVLALRIVPPGEKPLVSTGKTKRSKKDGAFTIKINDTEIDATGLPNPDALLMTGPCAHRKDLKPCIPCTEEAVKGAHEQLAAEAAEFDPRKVFNLDKAREEAKAKGEDPPLCAKCGSGDHTSAAHADA